ncbi:hypothetical protein BESB_066370 [Besnoitia besnoiti]|uniref:Uncharacterized protein n=1 Tax=Besnoitia besnoiti TaxID=94643 RepID=A0A2A9MBK6_BESBE|nr:hypothetical protein BESB_066370 [Besnoitia besnoiti]PFH34604.1 hypothetical protein BESB_066370 [Besnoitia besnoiti]
MSRADFDERWVLLLSFQRVLEELEDENGETQARREPPELFAASRGTSPAYLKGRKQNGDAHSSREKKLEEGETARHGVEHGEERGEREDGGGEEGAARGDETDDERSSQERSSGVYLEQLRAFCDSLGCCFSIDELELCLATALPPTRCRDSIASSPRPAHATSFADRPRCHSSAPTATASFLPSCLPSAHAPADTRQNVCRHRHSLFSAFPPSTLRDSRTPALFRLLSRLSPAVLRTRFLSLSSLLRQHANSLCFSTQGAAIPCRSSLLHSLDSALPAGLAAAHENAAKLHGSSEARESPACRLGGERASAELDQGGQPGKKSLTAHRRNAAETRGEAGTPGARACSDSARVSASGGNAGNSEAPGLEGERQPQRLQEEVVRVGGGGGSLPPSPEKNGLNEKVISVSQVPEARADVATGDGCSCKSPLDVSDNTDDEQELSPLRRGAVRGAGVPSRVLEGRGHSVLVGAVLLFNCEEVFFCEPRILSLFTRDHWRGMRPPERHERPSASPAALSLSSPSPSRPAEATRPRARAGPGLERVSEVEAEGRHQASEKAAAEGMQRPNCLKCRCSAARFLGASHRAASQSGVLCRPASTRAAVKDLRGDGGALASSLRRRFVENAEAEERITFCLRLRRLCEGGGNGAQGSARACRRRDGGGERRCLAERANDERACGSEREDDAASDRGPPAKETERLERGFEREAGEKATCEQGEGNAAQAGVGVLQKGAAHEQEEGRAEEGGGLGETARKKTGAGHCEAGARRENKVTEIRGRSEERLRTQGVVDVCRVGARREGACCRTLEKVIPCAIRVRQGLLQLDASSCVLFPLQAAAVACEPEIGLPRARENSRPTVREPRGAESCDTATRSQGEEQGNLSQWTFPNAEGGHARVAASSSLGRSSSPANSALPSNSSPSSSPRLGAAASLHSASTAFSSPPPASSRRLTSSAASRRFSLLSAPDASVAAPRPAFASIGGACRASPRWSVCGEVAYVSPLLQWRADACVSASQLEPLGRKPAGGNRGEGGRRSCHAECREATEVHRRGSRAESPEARRHHNGKGEGLPRRESGEHAGTAPPACEKEQEKNALDAAADGSDGAQRGRPSGGSCAVSGQGALEAERGVETRRGDSSNPRSRSRFLRRSLDGQAFLLARIRLLCRGDPSPAEASRGHLNAPLPSCDAAQLAAEIVVCFRGLAGSLHQHALGAGRRVICTALKRGRLSAGFEWHPPACGNFPVAESAAPASQAEARTREKSEPMESATGVESGWRGGTGGGGRGLKKARSGRAGVFSEALSAARQPAAEFLLAQLARLSLRVDGGVWLCLVSPPSPAFLLSPPCSLSAFWLAFSGSWGDAGRLISAAARLPRLRSASPPPCQTSQSHPLAFLGPGSRLRLSRQHLLSRLVGQSASIIRWRLRCLRDEEDAAAADAEDELGGLREAGDLTRVCFSGSRTAERGFGDYFLPLALVSCGDGGVEATVPRALPSAAFSPSPSPPSAPAASPSGSPCLLEGYPEVFPPSARLVACAEILQRYRAEGDLRLQMTLDDELYDACLSAAQLADSRPVRSACDSCYASPSPSSPRAPARSSSPSAPPGRALPAAPVELRAGERRLCMQGGWEVGVGAGDSELEASGASSLKGRARGSAQNAETPHQGEMALKKRRQTGEEEAAHVPHEEADKHATAKRRKSGNERQRTRSASPCAASTDLIELLPGAADSRVSPRKPVLSRLCVRHALAAQEALRKFPLAWLTASPRATVLLPLSVLAETWDLESSREKISRSPVAATASPPPRLPRSVACGFPSLAAAISLARDSGSPPSLPSLAAPLSSRPPSLALPFVSLSDELLLLPHLATCSLTGRSLSQRDLTAPWRPLAPAECKELAATPALSSLARHPGARGEPNRRLASGRICAASSSLSPSGDDAELAEAFSLALFAIGLRGARAAPLAASQLTPSAPSEPPEAVGRPFAVRGDFTADACSRRELSRCCPFPPLSGSDASWPQPTSSTTSSRRADEQPLLCPLSSYSQPPARCLCADVLRRLLLLQWSEAVKPSLRLFSAVLASGGCRSAYIRRTGADGAAQETSAASRLSAAARERREGVVAETELRGGRGCGDAGDAGDADAEEAKARRAPGRGDDGFVACLARVLREAEAFPGFLGERYLSEAVAALQAEEEREAAEDGGREKKTQSRRASLRLARLRRLPAPAPPYRPLQTWLLAKKPRLECSSTGRGEAEEGETSGCMRDSTQQRGDKTPTGAVSEASTRAANADRKEDLAGGSSRIPLLSSAPRASSLELPTVERRAHPRSMSAKLQSHRVLRGRPKSYGADSRLLRRLVGIHFLFPRA